MGAQLCSGKAASVFCRQEIADLDESVRDDADTVGRGAAPISARVGVAADDLIDTTRVTGEVNRLTAADDAATTTTRRQHEHQAPDNVGVSAVGRPVSIGRTVALRGQRALPLVGP